MKIPLLAAVTCLGLAIDVPANDDVIVTQFLASTGAAPGATAEARWRDKGDALDFQVELEDIASGSYELFVGGVQRGTIAVGGLGEGETEFKIPLDSPKPLFDFEVFDELIEVQRDGVTYFSDVFDGNGGAPGGGSTGKKSKIEIFMATTGVDLDAKGRLRHRVDKGVTRFDVELERLDAGSYDLLVGGVSVAAFEASGASAEEIEFEFRDPPEPGHLPLDFDVLGKVVDVTGAGGVVLTAVMPGDAASTGVKPPSKGGQAARDLGRRKRDALLMRLANTASVTQLDGDVVLEQNGASHQLVVRVENAQAGGHAVLVDGVQRGEVVVGADGAGELIFATEPSAGELALDFAVKGRLIEVQSTGATALAVVFPASVQHALDDFTVAKTTASFVRRDLVNAGSDLDARGLLVRRTKGANTRVVLKMRDLPLGTHTVSVGGIDVGSFEVTKEGVKSKLVLATQPKGKQLALPVDPFGVTVEVRAAGDVPVLAGELP